MTNKSNSVYLDSTGKQNLHLILKLRTFGLLQKEPIGGTETSYDSHRYGYTEKLFRFRYWLTYNNLYPTTVHAKYIGRITNDEADQDGSSA